MTLYVTPHHSHLHIYAFGVHIELVAMVMQANNYQYTARNLENLVS